MMRKKNYILRTLLGAKVKAVQRPKPIFMPFGIVAGLNPEKMISISSQLFKDVPLFAV
jgi:hypothetical protein